MWQVHCNIKIAFFLVISHSALGLYYYDLVFINNTWRHRNLCWVVKEWSGTCQWNPIHHPCQLNPSTAHFALSTCHARFYPHSAQSITALAQSEINQSPELYLTGLLLWALQHVCVLIVLLLFKLLLYKTALQNPPNCEICESTLFCVQLYRCSGKLHPDKRENRDAYGCLNNKRCMIWQEGFNAALLFFSEFFRVIKHSFCKPAARQLQQAGLERWWPAFRLMVMDPNSCSPLFMQLWWDSGLRVGRE